MKVKIKENINLAELKEDRWNGCKYDTMLLLQKYYDENETFEVKEMSNMGNYVIIIEGREWIVNPKVFEIIEEDKKIEKLDLDKEESLKAVIKTAQDYVLADKINEIIDYLEENKNEN